MCFLIEEIVCVICVCVVNFVWVIGMMVYGFCGVVEIVVMLDYMVVFVNLVGVVLGYLFDLYY